MQFAILASMQYRSPLILLSSFDVDLEAESIYKVRLWLPREWLISDWPSHRALYSSARTSSSSPLSSMHITMIIAGRRRRPLANIRRQRNAASSPVWLLLQPTHCRHLHFQHQQIPMETTKNKDLHPHQHRPCPLPACSPPSQSTTSHTITTGTTASSSRAWFSSEDLDVKLKQLGTCESSSKCNAV